MMGITGDPGCATGEESRHAVEPKYHCFLFESLGLPWAPGQSQLLVELICLCFNSCTCQMRNIRAKFRVKLSERNV